MGTTIFGHFLDTWGPQFGQRGPNESILNTHPIKVDSKFELDCVNTLSDNGRKQPFSVILWPLEDRNLANVAPKRINFEHLPNKCTHQVYIGLHENCSGNGDKTPFSVILWPLECHIMANIGPKWTNSDHSPIKCRQQDWTRLREYFFQIMVGNHHFDPLKVIFGGH